MKTTTTRTDKRNDERGMMNDEFKNVHHSSFRVHHSERGAALIALMALMTIMAIVLLAAAPSLLIDVQRGKEEVAIERGEEIANAIWIYVQAKGKLPEKMEDLTEGISIPGRTKKRMILRPSAAIDPLSSTGEWKTIQSGETKTLNEFQRKLVSYTGSNTFTNPISNTNPRANQILNAIAGQIIGVAIDAETTEDTEAPGGEDTSQNVDGPFIGVVTRSQRKSVISYYGIERHDRWIFTPLFRGTGTP